MRCRTAFLNIVNREIKILIHSAAFALFFEVGVNSISYYLDARTDDETLLVAVNNLIFSFII